MKPADSAAQADADALTFGKHAGIATFTLNRQIRCRFLTPGLGPDGGASFFLREKAPT